MHFNTQKYRVMEMGMSEMIYMDIRGWKLHDIKNKLKRMSWGL